LIEFALGFFVAAQLALAAAGYLYVVRPLRQVFKTLNEHATELVAMRGELKLRDAMMVRPEDQVRAETRARQRQLLRELENA